MAEESNKWSRPSSPPPPLFFNKKERDLVKQVNDELIERVIGQVIAYYPISLENTCFHSLYEEAIEKTFLPPIRVYALIEWGAAVTKTTGLGIDKTANLVIHFHTRRLNEDQNVNVQEGDFVRYDDIFYEIVSTVQPRRLFGQDKHQVEISANCIEARSGVFNAK